MFLLSSCREVFFLGVSASILRGTLILEDMRSFIVEKC